MLEHDEIDDFSRDGHLFKAVKLKPGWVQVAGAEYAQLRAGKLSKLREITLDGVSIVETDKLQALINSATIPVPSANTDIGNFDILRSDLGEVLSYLYLENNHNTSLCDKSITSRERHDMPGRGIDCVGIESAAKLCLVLGEVKVSDESSRKPKVVDDNHDSLSKSLGKHVAHRKETCKKLWTVVQKTEDEALQNRLAAAIFYFDAGQWDKVDIVCAAILVRPQNHYHNRDFGNLLSDQTAVHPGKVRFIIIGFDEKIGDAKELFRKAALGEIA